MFDTIKHGDTVLIWKNLMYWNAFKKNEVVLFQKEINDEVFIFIKRITAVPSDSIKADSNELFINGKVYPHDEIFHMMSDDLESKNKEYFKYLMNQSSECEEDKKLETDTFLFRTNIKVPPECYFFIGDNPYESMDSRFFGFIHENDIIGKVIVVF